MSNLARLGFPLVNVLSLQDLFRSLRRVLVGGRSPEFLGLGLDQALDAGSGSCVDDVVPVPGGVLGQLEEPLDEEDARVADLARPLLVQVEASHKHRLVLLAVGEAGAKKYMKFTILPSLVTSNLK